jgi:predicted Zn-dependent protease
VRRALGIMLWLGAVLVPIEGLRALAGNIGLAVGAVVAIVAIVFLWLALPRLAHAAFAAGRFARAARRYGLLHALALRRVRARAAQLSRAGCYVGVGRLDRAEALLETIDGAVLDASERAVWLNNRACAALAAGRDPEAALALADEAGALRPDVPALQHTRGMALLAVGRVDDAIAVLDGMRAAGELPPHLEADRCRELARAWRRKGQAAYADDYQLRADGFAR